MHENIERQRTDSHMEPNRTGIGTGTTGWISLGCFIRKPVTIDYLLKRIRSELD
jgi:hypothetical protein